MGKGFVPAPGMKDPNRRTLRTGILDRLIPLPLPHSVLVGTRLQRIEPHVRVDRLELRQLRFDVAVEVIRPGVVQQFPVDVGVVQRQ
jgi:hypothetical protein